MVATRKLPLLETKKTLQTLGRTPGIAKPPRSPKARLATARGPLEVGCQALAPCLATPQRGWPPNTTPWQCLTPRRAPGQSRSTPSLRRKLPPILATTSQPRSTSARCPSPNGRKPPVSGGWKPRSPYLSNATQVTPGEVPGMRRYSLQAPRSPDPPGEQKPRPDFPGLAPTGDIRKMAIRGP